MDANPWFENIKTVFEKYKNASYEIQQIKQHG